MAERGSIRQSRDEAIEMRCREWKVEADNGLVRISFKEYGGFGDVVHAFMDLSMEGANELAAELMNAAADADTIAKDEQLERGNV